MTITSLSPSMLSAVPHASLRALRAALVRDMGDGFAAVLQETGYAGGESVWNAFNDWCDSNSHGAPESMSVPQFQQAATRFFSDAGWGTMTLNAIGDTVVALDSPDWAESDVNAQMPYPSCYYSAGMLGDFFGRVADGALGCIEVECRSAGHSRCRFLLGSQEVLGHVYQRLTQGVGYEDALAELG